MISDGTRQLDMNRQQKSWGSSFSELEGLLAPSNTSFLGLRSFSAVLPILVVPTFGTTHDRLSITRSARNSSRSEYGDATRIAQEADTGDVLKTISLPVCTKTIAEVAMWKALSHESIGSPIDSYCYDSTVVSSPCALFEDDVGGLSFEQFLQKHAELLWSDVSSDSSSTTAGDDVFDCESLDDYCVEEDYEPELLLLDLSASNLDIIPSSILAMPDALINIAVLDLSHNVFDPNGDYLVDTILLPYLNTLSIHSCGLTTLEPLFRRMIAPRLQSIDLSHHRVTGPVPRFRYYWPTIENVCAADGWFDALDAPSTVDLKMLDLRNNLITRESISEIADVLEESGATILV